MNLFQMGEFRFHSGGIGNWKIDCDALTDGDLAALAEIVAGSMVFGAVIGVPTGGLRFAEALRRYSRPNCRPIIADDVLTTGRSMAEMRVKYPDAQGVVIFSRGPCIMDWVTPLFTCALC